MNTRWVGLGLLAAAIVGVGLWILSSESGVAQNIDLIERLPQAVQRAPYGHTVTSVSVDGDEKRAIQSVPESRFIWKLRVPRDAWLRTAIATHPDTWTKECDGVLFRIGVSDGRHYEQLMTQHVNPVASESDRRWIQVNLDLSAFAEQEVEVIFNTNTSPPPGGDRRNDIGLWGEPEIYVR